MPTIDTPTAGHSWNVNTGELLIVPIKELYDRKPPFRASEELLHEHMAAPYVILNTDDAIRVGIADGDMVLVNYGAQGIEVQAKVLLNAPPGAALLPRHLTDRPTPAIPIVGTIRKVEVMANARNS